jgi:penicillin G amidase
VSTQDLRSDTDRLSPSETEPTGVRIDGSGIPPRRRWRRVALWVLGLLLALVLVATGLSVWTVRRSFPELDGRLAMTGLAQPVTVYRDSYGVPQVYAGTEADLFMALGYVHAQDRFWEMDFRRHLTAGRLAEMFGPSLVSTDAFVRTLGWRRAAAAEWSILAPRTRADLRAYADGVNAWIADHGGRAITAAKSLEYGILGVQNSGFTVEKWDPVDSLAWLKAMAWDMRSNMDAEMIRSTLLAYGLSRAQIDQLYPPYPYAMNRPVIKRVSVRDGAFETAAAAAADRARRDAAPALDSLRRAIRSTAGVLGVARTGIGSNAWVVSGSLTASGRPLLANDPHLRPSLPGMWYQVGLHCACGYDVAGFSFAGVPGVIIGHNARIAWGLTNLSPDVTDLYLEKVDGDRYFDGTAWRPLDQRTEVIRVDGGQPVTITVRATRHGPLLSDRSSDLLAVAARPPMDASAAPLQHVAPGVKPSLDAAAPGVPAPAAATPYAVALRWTALDPGHTSDAIFALNRAANWTQFRAAAALFDVPAQNMVYADVDGNIGYQTPGRIPIRLKGDGLWPAPGWDPAYDWKGFVPFTELPNVFNPPDGVIVTANQPPVGPPAGSRITRDWISYGYRSQRVFDMIAERAARGKLTVDDMRQMQFDNRNGFAPVLVPALLSAPLDAPDTSTVARARALLKDWDYQQPAESPGRSAAAAAFYNATWRHLMMRTFDELPPGNREPAREDGSWQVMAALLAAPTSPWWDDKSTPATETMNDMLVAAMKDAAGELTDRLGSDPTGWRWGDLHTLTLQSETLGRSGIAPVEWLFNRGPVPAAGGVAIVNATSWSVDAGYEVTAVPSMRMIVDLSNLDRSRWIQLTGNSGHAFQANYTNQLDLWRTGRDTPMQWERTSIDKTAEHTLMFEPAPAG